MDSCAVKGARTKRSNLHNAPLFLFLDFGEEVVVDGGLAQMRLQAERQLQEPFPLSRLDSADMSIQLDAGWCWSIPALHNDRRSLEFRASPTRSHQGLYLNEPIKISHNNRAFISINCN